MGSKATGRHKRHRGALSGRAAPDTREGDPKTAGLTPEDLAKELDTYSTTISTLVRTINLGVLGLAWLLLLRDEKLARLANAIPERALLTVSAACVVAMVLELAQYVLAERSVESTFQKAEENGVADGYDVDSWSYRGQYWCYKAKVWVTGLAALSLVALVFMAIY